jgi:hypothetical protein
MNCNTNTIEVSPEASSPGSKRVRIIQPDGTLFCGTVVEYMDWRRREFDARLGLPPSPPPQPEPDRRITIPPGCEGYGVGDRWIVKPSGIETSRQQLIRIIIGAIVAGLTASLTMALIHCSH